MTDTRITVDVSTEALLQRARQQQAQSRQAAIQREEERREVERQKREARKAGRDQPPGQDRLKGRSKLRGMAPRHEVAAGYVVDQILCIALYPRTSGLTFTPTGEGVPYAFFTPETIAGWWKLFNAKHHSSRRIVAFMDTMSPDPTDPNPQVFFDGNFQNSRIYMVTQFGLIGPDYVVPTGDLFIDFPVPYARLKRFSNDPEFTPGSTGLLQEVLASELAGVRKIIMTAFAPGATEPFLQSSILTSFVRWCADNKKILRGCEYKDLSGFTTGSGTGAYNYINCFDRPFSSYPLLLPPEP